MSEQTPSPVEGQPAPVALRERGVIIEGQRVATVMNDAPRALMARAPLILLPGATFPCEVFTPLLERVAGERRVFALDFPGFGASAQPAPADFAYTPAHLAEVLAAWMDALGLARAVLLAYQDAASVAVRFAAAHPKRVMGLALVGPLGVAPRGPLDTALDVPTRSLALLRLSERLLASLALGPTTEATRAIEDQRKERRAMGSAGAEAAARRSRTRIATVTLMRAMDAAQPETSRLARSVVAPCAVMRGGLDPVCSAAEARAVAEALGEHGALEVTLPGAGALPHLQQPERFVQALTGLITTAEASAG